MGSMTWENAVEIALEETKYGYQDPEGFDSPDSIPNKQHFLETFDSFYSELVAENRITIWPVDPPGSHRMAANRAAIEWADSYQ